MRNNVNRNKIFVLILCSFFISSVYQACGERYDGTKDFASNNQLLNSDYNLLLLDKINGTFRSLPVDNTKIIIGPVYKVVVADKNGKPFTGNVDWILASIPSNACSISASASNKLEAEITCTKESNVSLNIKIHPNQDPNAKVSIIDYAFSAMGDLALKSEGQNLYQMHCNACHNSASANYKKDKTADEITQAIFNSNIPLMNNLASLKLLTPTELRAIAKSVSTISPVDTIKPLVAISNPSNNQTIGGIIQVDIAASDEMALQKVSLELDMGIKIGSDQTSPPFVYSLDTTTLTKGEHFLKAIATDSAGNMNSVTIKVMVDNTVPPPVDTVVPTIAFISPADGNKIRSDFTARVNATDNVGVASVQFYLNNNNLGSADTSAPFEYTVPVASLTNGSNHQLKAEARDAAGNKSNTTITFIVDKAAPTVAISSPANGATISGVTPIKITATDAQGVKTTYIDVDGTVINLEDKTSPYEIALDTNNLTNGNHNLKAYAQDMAGNIGFKSINITVSNTNPYTVPENELAASYPVTTANILSGQSLWNTNCSSCHTTEKRGKTYAILRKQVGSLSDYNQMKTLDLISADVYKIYLYLNNDLDQVNPTVGFSSPANNATVSGSIAITATATDNKAVTSVSLYIDGVKTGNDLTATPYTFNVDTKTLSNASHTLMAKAKDAAGNEGQASISITVNNVIGGTDTTKPSVSFTQPAANQNLSGNFTAKINATDNVGVIGVKILVDNVQSGSELTAAPYDFNINTSSLSEGNHTLQASARDAAGNIQTSSVTIKIDKVVPIVAFTAPTANQSVSGTITVTSTATDNNTVAGVKWKVDNVDVGTEDTSSPYSFSLNTTTLGNGSHTLTASARDAAGNIASASVSFSANNADPYSVPESTLASTYPANAANIAEGQALFANNCMTCHSTTDKRDRLYSAYRAAIGSNSTVIQMKSLDLVSADVYKIYLYLNNAVNTGDSSALEQSQPLLGTRTYVASIFRVIFVSNAGNLADDTTVKGKITSLLLNQAGPMGGACQKNDITSTDSICATRITETSQGSMLPNANALRRGYITRACEEVLSLDQGVSSALQKVSLTSNSELNAANLAVVFDLFNPGTPMTAAIQTNLMKIVNSTSLTTNLDRWRYVLYGVCRAASSEVL